MLADKDLPTIERLDHKVKAKLELSGTTIIVGTYSDHQGDSLFILTDEQAEPTYISVLEGKLLISAIRASIGHLKEE